MAAQPGPRTPTKRRHEPSQIFGLPSLIPHPRDVQLLGPFLSVSLLAGVKVNTNENRAEPIKQLAHVLEIDLNAKLTAASENYLNSTKTSLLTAAGAPLKVVIETVAPQAFIVRSDAHGRIWGPELYELRVNHTSHTVLIRAPYYAGLVHGSRTLRQLLCPSRYRSDNIRSRTSSPSVALAPTPTMSLPAVRITDAPVSTYRGVMIDNVRNRHDFAFHMDMLERVGASKLNVYQLHASDDQGYSLPSKVMRAYTPCKR